MIVRDLGTKNCIKELQCYIRQLVTRILRSKRILANGHLVPFYIGVLKYIGLTVKVEKAAYSFALNGPFT